MTPFRQNLEQLRREHRAERYPGDLAAELLGAAQSHDADHHDDASPNALPLDGGPIPISRGQAPTPAASRWRMLFAPMALSAGVAAVLAVGVTLAFTGMFGSKPTMADRVPGTTGIETTQLPKTTPTKPTVASANTKTATTTEQQASFTVVPAVASSDESYSLVPAAPSFDFDLSATDTASDSSTSGSGTGARRTTRTQLN